MPAFVRKSLETDKKRKALEAQTPENWKSRHCSNPSTAPPPSIQARPALRAPGSTRAFNRARHLTRKRRKGKTQAYPCPGPDRSLPAQRRGWQLHLRTGEIGCSARPSGIPGGGRKSVIIIHDGQTAHKYNNGNDAKYQGQ